MSNVLKGLETNWIHSDEMMISAVLLFEDFVR